MLAFVSEKRLYVPLEQSSIRPFRSQALQSLQDMKNATHYGKVVLAMEGEQQKPSAKL
jgi:hypothetical protein